MDTIIKIDKSNLRIEKDGKVKVYHSNGGRAVTINIDPKIALLISMLVRSMNGGSIGELADRLIELEKGNK